MLASRQPVAPPSGVQQTQTLATQGANEDSATVDPQNRRERPFKVTTRSRRLTERGSTATEGNENCCRKAAKYTTEGQEAQVHGFR